MTRPSTQEQARMWDWLGIVADAVLAVAYLRVYICVVAGVGIGLLLNSAIGDSTAFLPIALAAVGLVVGVLWHRQSTESRD